jgi:hypothetical protein
MEMTLSGREYDNPSSILVFINQILILSLAIDMEGLKSIQKECS